ncbi:unnamed protein product [Effrenium voratum]|uniref:Uncharacterized protein n=1 Tax=Effrenium voratum TaxID=2562239 RepID=A0AA36JS67_9DINO|nr:unnamed protein product [Effrenium voratum]
MAGFGLCELPIGAGPELRLDFAETSSSRGLTGVVKTGKEYPPLDTEAVLEDGERVQLVHRIAVALASPEAYEKMCKTVFRKFAEPPPEGDDFDKCGLQTPISDIFEHLKLPSEHVRMFEQVLKKETDFKRKPEMLSFQLFRRVLIKVLRRIRDLYCVRVKRGQFVTAKKRKLEDEYERVGDAGRGCFGECFWVKHKSSGFRRVAKRILKKRVEVPKEEVEDEINLLRKLDHPHIVRLFEWFETADDFLLVMEGARAGDLGRALQRAKQEGNKGLDENTVRLLMEQALTALVYIHANRVIHRDIKPANMVLSQLDKYPPHLLLADFGIATVFQPDAPDALRGPMGTYPYMAPEIYDNNVTPKVDVWALGIVSYEVLCGHRPFGRERFDVEYQTRLQPAPVDMTALHDVGISQAAVKFIGDLLQKQEVWRPTSEDALKDIANWLEVAQPDGHVASMVGFSKKSTFSKAVYMCAASQLDASTLEDLNAMFLRLDADRNGSLSVLEFREGLRQVMEPEAIESLVDALDMDHSGSANYTEFIAGCLDAHSDLVESALAHVFRVFDVNGDGKISLKELSSILTSDGVSIVLPEGKTIEEFMKAIDVSQDGFISFEELKGFLQKEADAVPQVRKRGLPAEPGADPAQRGSFVQPLSGPGYPAGEFASQLKRCVGLSEGNAALLRDLNEALAAAPKVGSPDKSPGKKGELQWGCRDAVNEHCEDLQALMHSWLPHGAMERSTSCPAKAFPQLRDPRRKGGEDGSPLSPLSPCPASPLRTSAAGSPSWASRRLRAKTHRDGLESRETVSRGGREVRRPTSSSRLEPLAKGALRHQRPCTSPHTPEAISRSPRPGATALDFDAAEALGRKILGTSSWVKRIFEEFDGADCGYLWPAEFAALKSRFEEAMGGFSARAPFNFDDADVNMEGRVSLPEWELYATKLATILGETRCRVATERVLGSRKAENRRKVKHVFIFEGYEAQASVRLLEVCSKGHKNASLVEDIRVALAARADPNAGLASPAFNDYTPLIFLASAPPSANGSQVEEAMELLIQARADVHRECGPMISGRLVPLRFAARAQNAFGLKVLQKHVDLGDAFQWAAGENAEGIMLSELRKLHGPTLAEHIEDMNDFSHAASAQLRLFASPIFPGGLRASGALSLCKGTYDDGHVRRGQRADPNSPGLEGMTALMHMIIDGNVPVIQTLLDCQATLDQRDSSGATPLHFAALHAQVQVVKLLLDRGAEPSHVDYAGFSPWMVVGEATCFEKQGLAVSSRSASERAEDIRECLELLKPASSPEELIRAESPEALLALAEGKEGAPMTLELLQRKFRLHESLFFNPRMAISGAFEGRTPLNHFLEKWAGLMIHLLQQDPLEGDQKVLAKFLLNATKGPDSQGTCGHIHKAWQQDDNRASYRARLMDAVQKQLEFYVESAAVAETIALVGCSLLETSGPPSPMNEAEARLPPEKTLVACSELLSLAKDSVTIPQSWQEDPFWQKVQERQVLRYDPQWAQDIHDGASGFLQLLRLGAPQDASASLVHDDACAVSSIADYSRLRQVKHAQMKELYARGYVTYSNLCNEAFQDKMKEVVARARDGAQVSVGMPSSYVAAKRLQRILEKTLEAEQERAGWDWPQREDSYVRHTYCFYILDTVRMSFVCQGDTVPQQVHSCMSVLKAFQGCSVETDGVQLLRTKSGFASGAVGEGGYADVKLLCYTDLGVHTAFDGTEIPLRIIGEVQLILEGYEAVKKRMHLVYEVNRGSFDRKRRR